MFVKYTYFFRKQASHRSPIYPIRSYSNHATSYHRANSKQEVDAY